MSLIVKRAYIALIRPWNSPQNLHAIDFRKFEYEKNTSAATNVLTGKIGEAEFPLNAFYERPKSNAESDEMRKYFTQLRHEVGSRLVEKVSIWINQVF